LHCVHCPSREELARRTPALRVIERKPGAGAGFARERHELGERGGGEQAGAHEYQVAYPLCLEPDLGVVRCDTGPTRPAACAGTLAQGVENVERKLTRTSCSWGHWVTDHNAAVQVVQAQQPGERLRLALCP
jgi:hypothetical protein